MDDSERKHRVGAQIMIERISAGMGRAELASRLSVSERSVLNWEHGRTSPRVSELFKIPALLEEPEALQRLVHAAAGEGHVSPSTEEIFGDCVGQCMMSRSRLPSRPHFQPSVRETPVVMRPKVGTGTNVSDLGIIARSPEERLKSPPMSYSENEDDYLHGPDGKRRPMTKEELDEIF